MTTRLPGEEDVDEAERRNGGTFCLHLGGGQAAGANRRFHAARASTPLLMLNMATVLGCVFVTGMSRWHGDGLIQSLASSEEFAFALDEAVAYRSPFCWLARWRVRALYASPLLVYPAAALLAAWLSHRHGRRRAMWVALVANAAARVLQLSLASITQFFVALFLLHASSGMMWQVALCEVLEIAPPSSRGRLVASIFVAEALGNLTATARAAGVIQVAVWWAWRTIPAYALSITLLLMVLLVWLPETPASLVQRGRVAEGRRALQEMRGLLANVEEEFGQILDTTSCNQSFGALWRVLRSRPAAAVLAFGLVAVQLIEIMGRSMEVSTTQFLVLEGWHAVRRGGQPGPRADERLQTSIIAVASASRTGPGAKMSARINISFLTAQGSAWLIGTLLALAAVDARCLGRRRGAALFFALAALACAGAAGVLASYLHSHPFLGRPAAAAGALSMAAASCLKRAGTVVVYVFAMEIQPLRTRSLAIALAVGLGYGLPGFVFNLVALRWLCLLRGWGLYLLWGVMSALLAIAMWLLVFETRTVPTDAVPRLLAQHPLWRRCLGTVEPHPVAPTARAAGGGPAFPKLAECRTLDAPLASWWSGQPW